jgi:hypothetical protein
MELGLGFGSMTTKAGTDVSSDNIAGTVVTVSNTTNESKETTFGNNFIGNFRLGWRF